MLIPNPNTSVAVALWNRRALALKESSSLLADKPDQDDWTDGEYRMWRYATAISRRLEKLN